MNCLFIMVVYPVVVFVACNAGGVLTWFVWVFRFWCYVLMGLLVGMLVVAVCCCTFCCFV